MSGKLGDKHYIVPLPPSGIPANVRRLVREVRKEHGEAHVNFYQTPNVFRICTGTRLSGSKKYMRTSFWIEISNRPLEVRESPDWPLVDTR